MDSRGSWKEGQRSLIPPSASAPFTVAVDGYQFKEYEKPPLVSKKTFIRTHISGEQDRWVQCDRCFKLRKVSMDVLLNTRWTCPENLIWDPMRAHCDVANQLSNKEITNLFVSLTETSTSGLDTLENMGARLKERVPPTTTPTSCAQRSSRRAPSCVCIVCETVHRRFELMLKKNQEVTDKYDASVAQSPKKRARNNGQNVALPVPPPSTQAPTSFTPPSSPAGPKANINHRS